MNAGTAHKCKIVGVVALALVAVLALVVFFSFSHSGPEAHAASQGTVTAMRLDVPATAKVGSKFTVGIVGDLTPPGAITGFAVQILVDTGAAGVSYSGTNDCLAEVKPRPADNILAFCDSFTPILTGGHAWNVLTDLIPPLDVLVAAVSSKVDLVNASYT